MSVCVGAGVCGWPSASVPRQWLQSQRGGEGRGLAAVVSLLRDPNVRYFFLFSFLFCWWCVCEDHLPPWTCKMGRDST